MTWTPSWRYPPDMTETGSAPADTYHVVLLVEEPLSPADAQRVHSLHAQVDATVRYHVIVPCDDAAARVESAMGSLAAGEVLASPAAVMNSENLREVQKELRDQADQQAATCTDRLTACGASVDSEVVDADPIEALAAKVAQVGAAEAIILTRPHVVAEFFRMDWTHRARRKLGVPVLHLLEHETFDEQAGGGEGASVL